MKKLIKVYLIWLIIVPVLWLSGIIILIIRPLFQSTNTNDIGGIGGYAAIFGIVSLVIIPFIALCLTGALFIGLSFRSNKKDHIQKYSPFLRFLFKFLTFIVIWFILTIILFVTIYKFVLGINFFALFFNI